MAVVKMVGLFPAVGFVGRLAMMVPDMKSRSYALLSPSLFQPLSPTLVPTKFPPLLGTPLGTLLGTPFSYFPMLRISKLPYVRR